MGYTNRALKDQVYSLVVVDDATSVLTILGWVLREEGYIVNTFSRATIALSFMEKNHVHLVISDFEMPEMDGMEFVRKLRTTGWNGIFYFLSGHTSALKEYNLKEIGVHEVMEKPFDLHTLRKSIEQALTEVECL